MFFNLSLCTFCYVISLNKVLISTTDRIIFNTCNILKNCQFSSIFSTPAMFGSAFHPALWSHIFQFCIFHQCILVPQFLPLHFPFLHYSLDPQFPMTLTTAQSKNKLRKDDKHTVQHCFHYEHHATEYLDMDRLMSYATFCQQQNHVHRCTNYN